MKFVDKTQLLIILLIVITGYLVFSTNQLTTEVKQLQWQLSAQENRIINQISSIESTVDQMKKADRWYEEIEKPKPVFVNGEHQLNLKFKLMEYNKESKVSFHVKNFSSDEFVTYDATDIGSGIYEIQLSEIGPLNPVSKFDVQFSNPEFMSPLEFGERDNENILEYYISVEHDQETRVSETYQVHMYELIYNIFQPISGYFYIDHENNFIETNLESNTIDLQNVYYTIDRVEIQAYQDNKVVQWWEVKSMNTDSNWIQFVDTLEITEEYDNLYIEVKYKGRDENNHFINKTLIGRKRQ